MKYQRNGIADYYYSNEEVLSSIRRLLSLLKQYPVFLEPLSNRDREAGDMLLENTPAKVCSGAGPEFPPNFFERTPVVAIDDFYLIPTVMKTTIFYDALTDSFIKILHPVSFKNRALSVFQNRSGALYRLSGKLASNGIKIPEILSYGILHPQRRAFYFMKRLGGNSVHYHVVKEKRAIPFEICCKVLDELAKLHNLGYWFGDLRISHIFINHSEIKGFVDIDSIRRNRPFRLRNIAKDLAGINSPDIPLKEEDKKTLFDRYSKTTSVKNPQKLMELVKHYTRRRWKD